MKSVFTEDVAKGFKFATGVQSETVPYSTSTSRSCIEYTAEGNKTNYAVRTNGSLIGMPRTEEKLRPVSQLPMEKSSPVQRVSDWAVARKQRVGKLSLVSG